LEATLERLGHIRKRNDFGEHVARDGNPQPEARVAEMAARALVDERVVDATGRAFLIGRLEELVRAEVDAPVVMRIARGPCPSRRTVEREVCALRGHERLRQAQREAERAAVGAETDDLFSGLARREQAYFPSIRRIDVASDERRERGLASAFELDVVLQAL